MIILCSARQKARPFLISTSKFEAMSTLHLHPPQEQVDNGVPLATCLYLFGRWVRKVSEERGVVLMEPGQEYCEEMILCALATWSGRSVCISDCSYHNCCGFVVFYMLSS